MPRSRGCRSARSPGAAAALDCLLAEADATAAKVRRARPVSAPRRGGRSPGRSPARFGRGHSKVCAPVGGPLVPRCRRFAAAPPALFAHSAAPAPRLRRVAPLLRRGAPAAQWPRAPPPGFTARPAAASLRCGLPPCALGRPALGSPLRSCRAAPVGRRGPPPLRGSRCAPAALAGSPRARPFGARGRGGSGPGAEPPPSGAAWGALRPGAFGAAAPRVAGPPLGLRALAASLPSMLYPVGFSPSLSRPPPPLGAGEAGSLRHRCGGDVGRAAGGASPCAEIVFAFARACCRSPEGINCLASFPV